MCRALTPESPRMTPTLLHHGRRNGTASVRTSAPNDGSGGRRSGASDAANVGGAKHLLPVCTLATRHASSTTRPDLTSTQEDCLGQSPPPCAPELGSSPPPKCRRKRHPGRDVTCSPAAVSTTTLSKRPSHNKRRRCRASTSTNRFVPTPLFFRVLLGGCCTRREGKKTRMTEARSKQMWSGGRLPRTPSVPRYAWPRARG